MQRIAAGCLLMVMLVGCKSGGSAAQLGPPPDPFIATRQPRVIQPIAPPPLRPPPPEAPEPEAPSTLSAATIRVPGGIRRGLWKIIVVHHAATEKATPQGMDAAHRQRGWDCLGYHFVIGNGVNYPDGQLFVGPRWRQQKTGAHCKASAGRYMGVWRPNNFFNEHGIGICLIGNFEDGRPTARQLQTLRDLIELLCGEAGVSHAQVYGHGEITHRTACPGRFMDMSALRRAVAMNRDEAWGEVFARAQAEGLPGRRTGGPEMDCAGARQEYQNRGG